MDSNDQKKLAKLARVRENQRKSRPRKQEHICVLEQKLVALQEQNHRKDVEHRLTVQRLEAENTGLKFLLSRVGLSSNTIAEYVQATGDPDMTQKIAIPALRRPQTNFEPRDRRRKCPSLPLLTGDRIDLPPECLGRSPSTSISQKMCKTQGNSSALGDSGQTNIHSKSTYVWISS
ncbi:hypothetical protein BBP40_005687 [Aspergillus hancockii]|nr:hypothetical protein BBP40_005687 [Aspergillus hancockii]